MRIIPFCGAPVVFKACEFLRRHLRFMYVRMTVSPVTAFSAHLDWLGEIFFISRGT